MRCLNCRKKGIRFKEKICDDCRDAGFDKLDAKIMSVRNQIVVAMTKEENYLQLAKDQEEKQKNLDKELGKLLKEKKAQKNG